MQKHTPRAALATIVKAFKRLEQGRNYKAFRAYICSPAYRDLLPSLDADGFITATKCLTEAQTACTPKAPLKPKWSMRVTWGPEMVEKLWAAERKYGTDEGIARALGIPYHNARRARLRYVGKRPPQPNVAWATAA